MQPERWQTANAAAMLLAPGPHSHKYSRGVLGLRTGSSLYPGAAVLGAEAAWRTGIGSVRYFSQLDDSPPAFGLPSPAAAVLATRPETVCTFDSAEHRERCNAWVLGSGTEPGARSSSEHRALLELLAGEAPVVLDAGALDLVLIAHASGQLFAPTILTPHLGEFRWLCQSAGFADTPDSLGAAASLLASHLGVTVLLKGSITLSASPEGSLFECGPATPWLATAGTGDVLAGMLGALVATHAAAAAKHAAGTALFSEKPQLLAQLGATAVLLHDCAARIASGDSEATAIGGPITALDVAHAVPQAVQQIFCAA